MFSINPNFTSIPSYDQAVRSWQKAIIFPKDRKLDNILLPRGLVDVRKRHMTIERTPERNFILRLYNHPVVTWHPDFSFTLRGYDSRSTVVFVNRCTPNSVGVGMCGGCFSLTVDGRTYRVSHEGTTFRQRDNTWKADHILPWRVPFVNRERAERALREVGYKEFRAWFLVYVQMAPQPAPADYRWLGNTETVEMLRDRRWRELVGRRPAAWRQPELVLSEIRKAIYHEYECTDHKSVPFLS